MKRSRLLAVLAVFGLAGCGRVGPLQPAPGHAMPIKPEMARATPTVDELLTPPTYARPGRVDELVTKSQPRTSDPFDLPPPSGGAAPSQPAGKAPTTVPATTTTTASPTPGA
jgi:predicted small lipoprotein YifL